MKNYVSLIFLLLFSLNEGSYAQNLGRNFGVPFDLKTIKVSISKYSTSGIVSENQTDAYCQFEEEGIYGSYQLFDNEESEYQGQMIIFFPGKSNEWKFDNEGDVLLSFITESRMIRLWDTNLIGITTTELNEFVKGNFHYLKGQTYYADLGDYSCVLYLKNGLTYKVEVKRNCLD